ncbi:ABC transporter permease [Segetibacter aerophilus]|uniref:ABC transporter permease n=1 Tax=Segetibacter aerophilus TaxID=670293 RepID=A0A512BBJ3_9BACT|nr:FtsX-like permease family protein [Segetibacter aerophilus]GEO09207.1 ABC transporter permease [Segetibacter aerophilus]
MLRNYFKIALRNFYKNKLYSFVNITGLSIGICSCILIGVYIMHEISFDRFHANADRIVRVTMDYNNGNAVNKVATTGTKVGPEFNRSLPEVEGYSRTLKYTRVIGYGDKVFEEKNFLYADSAFFSMFSFKSVAGDPSTALNAPDKIVLTQSAAKKYFGKADPLGKILKVGTKDFMVTAIAMDAPDNSQIKFDFVGSFTSLGASKEEKWWEANYITYLLLNPKANIDAVQKRVTAFMQKVSTEELKMKGSEYLTYHLEPLTKVHLYSSLDGLEPNNNIVYIYVLAVVAILILLIACVNYTNLSTAQSASRSAEIGMRKVLGAQKKQVFKQFIGEGIFFTLVSVIVALALSYLLLPLFNDLAGKELTTGIIFQPVTILSLLALAMIVAFTAGSYPALILSNVKLIKVLKSGFSFSQSGNGIRKSLIVFQFVISIFLITSTIVILKQLSFIANKDLGYNKEQIVVLPVDNEMLQHYDDLKKAFKNDQNVISIGGAYEKPTNIGWGDGLQKSQNDQSITVNAFPVDEGYARTLGVKIIAGSDYTQADVQQFDTSNNGSNLKYTYMLNESAVKSLGWKPEEAIGKTVFKGREGIVKAVVKDFHFRSFHEPINPLVIFLDKRMLHVMFVKINGKNVASTIDQLKNTWKNRVTHRPFEYHFLDEDYNALYQSEQKTAGVFTTFSSIAILLACLGLFALSAFELVKRSKEIGIRKVLGATMPDLVRLLTMDFVKLIVLACLIAFPVSWYVSSKWLEDFTYRIDIQWWMFIVAGVVAIVIALLTISLQAIKAALSNPVKSLRTE